MADHGQPDIAGAAATAQAGPAQAEVAASPHPGAVAPVEAPPVHHGRPISWVAVSIIVIGFLVGGVALIFGPAWLLFWVGCGIAGFGGILALAAGIFDDWY
jgi:hypothetical protein